MLQNRTNFKLLRVNRRSLCDSYGSSDEPSFSKNMSCVYYHILFKERISTFKRKLRVFENIVLRRIFGTRRDEVMGEWRRMSNEELNDLYSSSNIVRVIKSRRMKWAGHVTRMGEERGCIGSWWGNRRERDH